MKKNNIVSLLMDKVPRKYREGYVQSEQNGAYILCEIKGYDSIRHFLENNRLFGQIGEDNRDEIMATILEAGVEYPIPGRWTPSLLLKIRLNERSDGGSGYWTALAGLGTRYCEMWTVINNGELHPAYAHNSNSQTMTVQTLLEVMADAPALACVADDNMDPVLYTAEKHGVYIE